MTKVYENDVGIEIRLDTGQSLTGATILKIKVQKPDGSTAEWTATQYNSTTIVYTTVAGDLSANGNYVLQAYVEWGSSSKHTGESVTLKVYDPFE